MIPTKEENCIEIQNLVKKFDNKIVLNNINLNIKKGSITALIGADGAGKTTLLRLIVGLLCNFEGKITTLDLNPAKNKTNIVSKTGICIAN